MRPVSCDSLSMLVTPFCPRNVRAVIREGRPKLNSPKSSTDRPFTCPTTEPSTSTMRTPRVIISRMRSSTRFNRNTFSPIARSTSCALTIALPACSAQ